MSHKQCKDGGNCCNKVSAVYGLFTVRRSSYVSAVSFANAEGRSPRKLLSLRSRDLKGTTATDTTGTVM